MALFRNSMLATGLLLVLIQAAVAADVPSLDGKWFRYPGLVDPIEELLIPAPQPVSDPPLKEQFMEAWRAERARKPKRRVGQLPQDTHAAFRMGCRP